MNTINTSLSDTDYVNSIISYLANKYTINNKLEVEKFYLHLNEICGLLKIKGLLFPFQ